MHIAQKSFLAPPSSVRKFAISAEALGPIAAAVDAALLLFASATATLFYRLYANDATATPTGALGVGVAAAFLFTPIARTRGLYRFEALIEPAGRLVQVARALILSLLLLTFILFLLKTGAEYSRFATIAFAVLAAFLAPTGRIAIGAAARAGIRSGVLRGRPAVVLGDAAELECLSPVDLLRFGVNEVARVVLGGNRIGGKLNESDRDRVSHAVSLSRELGAVEFALLMPWGRDRELAEVSRLLQASPLPVRLYPDRKVRAIVRQQKGRDLDPYFSVKIQREPLARWERSIKRTADAAIAGTALVMLSPLLLLTALLIKLDSRGPAIFRQQRCGFDNREFVIFKFRTMTVMEDDRRIEQTHRNDKRVTRVGRFLRRASIDELPQLLNVLRGEMSLVGPRPHAMAHDDEYKARIDNYALRHHVKPGLTGAAQVAGLRGETQNLALMKQRVERDLWYINNWSLTLDLKILAQTCVALLRDDAY